MKRGFTLIELLAVIVILAIIALIATPIVLSIIEDTKESAVLRSAEHYLSAVEQSIMKKNLDAGGSFSPNICEVQSDGNLLCDGKDELKIEVSGERPSSGTITFDKGKITNVELTQANKTITKDEKGELVLGEVQEEIKLSPGLYDKNDNLLLSWDKLKENDSDFVNKIQNGGVNEDTGKGLAGEVIDSIAGASKLVIGDDVTSIGDEAFWGCSKLIDIIVPDNVTSIGSSAFNFCGDLITVKIGNNVTSIGNNAFANTNLESIILPGTVADLGTNIFEGCSNLTSVTLPEGIKYIPISLFLSCSNLKSITIPSSVEHIGAYAFNGSGLESITIPSSVTTIGEDVFGDCEDLTIINHSNTAAGYPWGAPNLSSN